jgi:hypothetical protein
MSTVKMSSLKSKNSDGAINIASGDTLYYPGKIAQVVQIRSDQHLTFSSPNTGNGTTITPLGMTIVPKFANSLLAITFMINGEVHEDNVFIMHRNDELIADTSHEGFNNVAGNVRSSGIASAFYDQNQDSTPSNWHLQYFIPAVNVESRTYAPAVRSSSGSNHTFALNRTINAASQDSYERMVSTGTIMEILQSV